MELEPVTGIEKESAGTMLIKGAEGEAEILEHHINEMLVKVDRLGQRVHEIEQFYSANNKKVLNNSKGGSASKDNDKVRHITSIKKLLQDAAIRENAASKRMQELMRQFGLIMRQVTQLRCARAFVELESDVINDDSEENGKSMDFTMIKKRMEKKDGAGYKHVREIYADVRMILKNTIKNNDEKSDLHVTAKTLLDKFEEKWLQLLPKVIDEDKRREEEEAEAQMNMQFVDEAAHAKMAKDLSNELYKVDKHLDKLRELVVAKCRKMSTLEKRQLGTALTRLSPEDLSKALEIVAQSNPGFQATGQEVDLDIDAQSETTLRRLKCFVKETLQAQGKPSTTNNSDDTHKNNIKSSKRKADICNALAKNANKKMKKLVVGS